MTAPNSLVLGLGNPLADADGFGPAVVQYLRASRDVPPDVELIDVHTDLLGFLDRFTGPGHVILVDAMLSAGSSGIAVFSEETFSAWETRSTGVHGISALAVVKLFRQLQRPTPTPFRDPRITLVVYLVHESDFSQPLEPAVIRAGAETVQAQLTRR